MYVAAQQGHVGICSILVEANADMNVKDKVSVYVLYIYFVLFIYCHNLHSLVIHQGRVLYVVLYTEGHRPKVYRPSRDCTKVYN